MPAQLIPSRRRLRPTSQKVGFVDTRSPFSALSTPPEAVDRFRTDDFEEVRAYHCKLYGPQSREVLGRGRVGYEVWRLSRGAVELNWVRQRLPQLARGEPGACVVHVPLSAELRYSFGRRTMAVRPGEAQFVVPGQRYSIRSEPGAFLTVSLPLHEVEREVRPYLGRAEAEWQPAPCKLLMSGPAATQFRERVASMVGAGSSGAAENPQPSLQIAQAELLAWLGRNLDVSGGLQRASPVVTARAREAEDWIAAHLNEPITLGRLCEVAGVGGRALQKTFMLRHGVPPMQFVTDRRLEAVRARLQAPDPDVLVTGAAMECGFTHMGRFSILYRQRFGESPSTTRRRALRSSR